jgi:Galactose oxidase, central domain/Kelch motif
MDDDESTGSGDDSEARNIAGADAAAESASSSNMQAGLRMLSLASPPNVAPNNINTARLSSATMSHQALLRQQAHGMVPYSATSTSTNSRSSSAAASINRNNATIDQIISARSPSVGGNYSHNNNNNSNNAQETSATNNLSAYLGLAGAAVAMPPSDRHDNNNHRISTGRISFVVPEHGAVDGEDGSLTSAPTNGWCTVETNGGTPPSARSLHAAALLNGILYVFGGYDGMQRVNTFHAFSFAEKRWSPVLPSANSANPPSPRDRHVALAFGNSFYVHGGFDGTSRVSDFWGFDFSSMTWREVVVLQGRPPSPRHSHAAVVHRHSLYIFGVSDDMTMHGM